MTNTVYILNIYLICNVYIYVYTIIINDIYLCIYRYNIYIISI